MSNQEKVRQSVPTAKSVREFDGWFTIVGPSGRIASAPTARQAWELAVGGLKLYLRVA